MTDPNLHTESRTSLGTATPVNDPLEETLRRALEPRLVVLRLIGKGGMARVYLARDPALKRLVAVKVLSPAIASDEARARFEREAQAVASLAHPNIVAIHSVGELPDGTPYFVMQYVEGRSLAVRLEEQGPLGITEARRALGQVAAALAAAHAQGIIHRDIKAANILQDDASGRVLVSDFGIATVAPRDDVPSLRLTGTGIALGTPMYMSPEQLLSEDVSEKTDVYALGLLAHELITGHGPFVASTPGEIIAAHLRDTAPHLSTKRVGVDAELDELVARCLEKDAAKRPSAEEIARRLLPDSGALIEWPPPGLEALRGALREIARRTWMAGTAIGIGLVPALMVGAALSAISAAVLPALLSLLALGGLLALAMSLRRIITVGVRTTRAVRAGYRWPTVLETMADRDGDAGALISGAREYASLDVTERIRLRVHRIVSASLAVVGGLLLAPALFTAVALGSRGAGGLSILWICLSVPLMLGAASLFIDAREFRLFASRRRARVAFVPEVDVTPLIEPWYRTLERAGGEHAFGRGSTRRPSAARVAAIGAAALVLAAALCVMPLLVLQAALPSLWTLALPKYDAFFDKLERANDARDFALPRDSSITALAAGRALATLYTFASNSSLAIRPLPHYGIPQETTPLPADLFPTSRPDYARGLPSTKGIIAAAARGLSPREMAFLSGIAHASLWRAFDTVAIAARVDFIGARFVLPFPASATYDDFPIPSAAGLRTLTYAAVARGAYYLAAGRRDSAEHALRSALSFSYTLIDQSNTLLDELIAIVMAGTARQALIDYYLAVGDPRGRQLAARHDSVLARVEARSGTATFDERTAAQWRDAFSARRRFIEVARDTTAQREIRLEMLHSLAAAPCTDVREMIFGAETDVRAAFAEARRSWARFASDTALLAASERLPRFSVAELGLGPRVLSAASHATGAVIGNPRLGRCADLVLNVVAR